MTFLARLSVACMWLAMFLVALLLYLIFWPLVGNAPGRERRRGIAPPTKTFPSCTEQLLTVERERNQRDLGDETDVIPEGLGPMVMRRHHSPTTPLAYLTEGEWQLWTSVIAESAR